MILVKAETNELFLDGIIGSDWMSEGITAAAVGDALGKISGRATLRINSPGGSADEGVAIYNLLRRHAGGVDTHNEALAASAASIVFLAGEKRTMERGSRVMIHCAHCMAIGNRAGMAKMAEVLAVYDASMADIYAEHMGIDAQEVLALMEEETWYDAETAMSAGLATDMAPTVRKKSAKAAAWFKHPPKDLFEEKAVESASKEAANVFIRRKEADVMRRKA